MSLAVRPYRPSDRAAFLELYGACLRHYACGSADPAMLDDLLRELAADFGTHADIAWTGDRPIGFAFTLRVPAGSGFATYLKELFVAPDGRGSGAGRALMRTIAARVLTMGHLRLQWETGEPGAREFYAALGAPDDGKTHYTLSGPALARLADGSPGRE
ncbi:GNAT family N-acetyltransferase [Jannaschia marina]|uniref:GNAT family N-acetyltransferase n=1 Tax=Jannaschia marina TaxID=2741674 RepID=UPI0015C74BE7|nr:GNAT family N-acetyltransferase [Jannaschia marina]